MRRLFLFLFLCVVPMRASEVSLAWVASPTSGVGYNVYRGASGSTPLTKVGSTSTLAFIDTTVVAGSSYSYGVTAAYITCPINTPCESVLSSVVNVSVPSATPPPPTLPQIGNRIKVIATANIRATAAPYPPGGALIGTEPANATGTVVGGPVTANSTFSWIQVKFDTCGSTIPNCTGWMGSDNMTVTSTTPPPPTQGMTTTCVFTNTTTWVCTSVLQNVPAGQAIQAVTTTGTLSNTSKGTVPAAVALKVPSKVPIKAPAKAIQPPTKVAPVGKE